VVQADAKQKSALMAEGRLRAKGIARQGVLDGEVRAALRESGLVLDDNYWVLQTALDPGSGKTGALALAGFALFMGPVIYALRRRVAR
jgi:hypothetical protein